MIKNSNKIIYLLLFVLSSCFLQKPPEVVPDNKPPYREVQRRKSCEKVVYDRNVLKKDNLTSMFSCYFWNETYPALFEALNNIDSESWDHIIQPIDEGFFNDLDRRARFFEYTRALDRKGGLDDLSFVFTSFFENNFYDALKDAFNCHETPDTPSCSSRDRIIQKDEMINILKRVKFTEEELVDLYALVTGLVDKLKNTESDSNRESELKSAISKIVFTDKFTESRIAFLDTLSEKALREGIVEKDITVLSKLMSTFNSDSDEPWLKHFVNRASFTTEKFQKLVRFTYVDRPTFLKDLIIIKSQFENGLTCKGPDDYNLNFDLRESTRLFLEKTGTESINQVRDHILHETYSLLPAAEFCPEVRNMPGTFFNENGEIISGNVDLIEKLEAINDYYKEGNFFDLSKYIITTAFDEGDKESYLYLYDFITGSFFGKLNNLNKVVDTLSPKFLSTLFKVIKDLDTATYLLTDRMFKIFYSEESKSQMVDIAKLWSFYEDNEKNFIFKYVDRHFRDEANFILLFDYYNNLMSELPAVLPGIAEKYVGDDTKTEKTFNSIKDIVNNFAGDDVLENLARFFSRDQVITLIEILIRETNTSGSLGKLTKKSSNYMKRYLENADRLTYYVLESTGADSVSKCVEEILSSGLDYYRAVVSLPQSCKDVESSKFTHKMFGWLNFVASDYHEYSGNESDEKLTENLFDPQGIFSKNMLSSSIKFLTVVDKTLGFRSESGRGLSYVLEVLKNQFLNNLFEGVNCLPNQKCSNLLSVFDKFINVVSKMFQVDVENNIKYRSRVIETYTDPLNFARTTEFLDVGTSIMGEWAKWVDDGKIVDKYEYKYDPKYSCENYLNQNIGGEPCSGPEYVKEKLRDILRWATNDYNGNGKTTATYLASALLPNGGLKLPLNSKKQTPYVITLKETAQTLYALSDKSLPVNNQFIKYRQAPSEDEIREMDGSDSKKKPKFKKTDELMTTAERIEVVIRDVRFDRNFLGANYLNEVTHAKPKDYDDAVGTKKKLFKMCTKPWLKWCGKKIKKSNYRLVKNAVGTLQSLLDLNKEKYGFTFGNYIQALVGVAVAGSLEKAQKPATIPFTDAERLDAHNGKIVTNTAMLSFFGNGGRFVHDRFGRTKEQFQKFINSERLNRVNDQIFKGFPVPQTEEKMTQILTKIQKIKDSNNQTAMDNLVDWVSSLNYNETRLMEAVLGKALVIATYLGPQDGNKEYGSHSFYKVFRVLDIVLDAWVETKESFPANKKFIDLFTPLNNFLTFYLEGLEDKSKGHFFYNGLNLAFNILEETLLEAPKGEKKGVNFLTEAMANKQTNSNLQDFVGNIYKYVDTLHYKDGSLSGERFGELAENGSLLIHNQEYSMEPTRLYLQHTTVECKNNNSLACVKNYHFDELAKLTGYLTKKDEETSQSYFEVMVNKLLKTEYTELRDLIDEVFSVIRLKKNPNLSPSIVH